MKTLWISRTIISLGLTCVTSLSLAQEEAPELPPADAGITDDAAAGGAAPESQTIDAAKPAADAAAAA